MRVCESRESRAYQRDMSGLDRFIDRFKEVVKCGLSRVGRWAARPAHVAAFPSHTEHLEGRSSSGEVRTLACRAVAHRAYCICSQRKQNEARGNGVLVVCALLLSLLRSAALGRVGKTSAAAPPCLARCRLSK